MLNSSKSGDSLGLHGEPPMVDNALNVSNDLVINDEQLTAAFDFFDMDQTGELTSAGLKKRMSAFYRNLPQKELKMLLGEGPFTKETLRKVLSGHDLGSYDPVKEAFKSYDPNGFGHADPQMLRHIFEALGYGHIMDDDLRVLIEVADVDRDGQISLDDFRAMHTLRNTAKLARGRSKEANDHK